MLRKKLLVMVVVGVLVALSLAPALAQAPTDFTFTGWSLNEGATRDVIMLGAAEYAEANGVTITDVAYPYNEYLNQVIL
ncbi:MAG: hypothetical protein JXN59_12260, partial [Anaerolineae bacterium]|nr:hypothetical protein [Anaerolineae bacterium]